MTFSASASADGALARAWAARCAARSITVPSSCTASVRSRGSSSSGAGSSATAAGVSGWIGSAASVSWSARRSMAPSFPASSAAASGAGASSATGDAGLSAVAASAVSAASTGESASAGEDFASPFAAPGCSVPSSEMIRRMEAKISSMEGSCCSCFVASLITSSPRATPTALFGTASNCGSRLRALPARTKYRERRHSLPQDRRSRPADPVRMRSYDRQP